MKPAVAGSPDVIEFLELWGLSNPIILKFQEVNPLYKQDFCHVSAKHAASTKGGERIHGWALWQYAGDEQNGPMVFGNFHSVWKNSDGKLIDVTPPKFEADHVLFVPHPELRITNDKIKQGLYNDRTNFWDVPFYHHADGQTSNVRVFINNDHPHLDAYCKSLGLPDTDMQ